MFACFGRGTIAAALKQAGTSEQDSKVLKMEMTLPAPQHSA